MPTKLAINRPEITNVEDAVLTFSKLAYAAIQIARIRAQAEARIATIKRETAERETEHAARLAECEAHIRGFIMAHPEHFQKPRQVKTEWGAFGLRTLPADVVITDAEALEQDILEHGYDDCLKTTRTPVKPALRKRLEDGEKIAGVELREGYEEAIYTVAKNLLDEARQTSP